MLSSFFDGKLTIVSNFRFSCVCVFCFFFGIYLFLLFCVSEVNPTCCGFLWMIALIVKCFLSLPFKYNIFNETQQNRLKHYYGIKNPQKNHEMQWINAWTVIKQKKIKVFPYIYIFSHLDNNNLKILNKYFAII